MNKEFVTYNQALTLKELGFDEPCFGIYYGNGDNEFMGYSLESSKELTNKFKELGHIPTPLYQQTFRWFREKYNIQGYIYSSTVRGNTEKTKQFTGYIWNINGIDTPFLSTDARDELHDTYEEAESACLNKLIEICKNK